MAHLISPGRSAATLLSNTIMKLHCVHVTPIHIENHSVSHFSHARLHYDSDDRN